MRGFLGLGEEFTGYDSARVAVLPIAFDKTCSWRRGTSAGPQAIIEASHNLELYDIETRSEMYRHGIYTAPELKPQSSEKLIKESEAQVTRFLGDGKFVVTLGGEHSISFAPIRAHARHFGKISVLQLDAHTDMRDSYEGDKHSHASVMARASEVVERVVAVGIRSMDISEVSRVKEEDVFYAENIRSNPKWINDVISRLTENVYVTLDVDVFEIGLMSSTGTPEPGGLGWYDVISLFKAVAQQRNVVGFDAVELLPNEHNPAPDFLTAKVIYKLLSYKFCGS